MDTSPHTSDFVTVNGIRLHYLDWGGRGPALVFLAGLGCNAYIFDRLAPRFGPGSEQRNPGIEPSLARAQRTATERDSDGALAGIKGL